MIHPDTISSTQVFAVDLASRGCCVNPIPNTILSDLYGYTIPPLSALPNSQTDLDAFYDMCSAATQGNHDYSFHDKAMDTAVSELSRLVTTHISHIKGKIVPKVEAFKSLYNDYLLKNSVKNPSEDFEVRAYETPEILTNERFLALVSSRDGKDPINFKYRLGFEKANSVEDIKHIFTLNNPKIDQDISKWVSSVGHEWIVSTYNDYLSNVADGYFDAISRMNYYDAVNHGILFILVGNASKELGDKYTWFREYGYDLVFKMLKKIELFQKSKKLIVDVIPSKKTICVDKKVYDDWLNEGGDPEVILGILVSPSEDRSYILDTIVPKSKKYKDAWYQFCAYNRSAESVSRDRNLREFLKLRSYELIDEIANDESGTEYKSEIYRKMALSLCDAEIFGFKDKQLNSPFEIAVTLVAKCGYYKTCGYEFICDMEKAAEENKEISEKQDSRAAATIAAVRYLAEYMVSQMSITRVPV